MIEIKNTTRGDIDEIFGLFEQSVVYQEKNSYPSWRNYDRNAIIKDIEAGNQYQVAVDSRMAMVFSVCYTDKVIWRDHEQGRSVYLHRIVVNPDFKGRRLFATILEWTITHARQRGLDSVRLDTWAGNPTLINYYMSFGFDFIENYTTPDSPDLPVHNRRLALALLEYKVAEGSPPREE